MTSGIKPKQDNLIDKGVPYHVAIIMDGNGRWAKKRLLPRVMGHREGAKIIKRIVNEAQNIGIKVLTVYAFSTENWSRPKAEVDALMSMFSDYIRKEKNEMMEKNIRLVFSGTKEKMSEELLGEMKEAEEYLGKNNGITFNIALNYGGRKEITDAVNKLVEERVKKALNGEKSVLVTEKEIAEKLYHPEIPDPELVIRTSGEYRLSNFLLWETAYSEIYVTEKLWPDFNEEDLNEAVKNYKSRDRRFGGVSNGK